MYYRTLNTNKIKAEFIVLHFPRLFLALILVALSSSAAAQFSVDAPRVMLSGVAAAISVEGLQSAELTFMLDGEVVREVALGADREQSHIDMVFASTGTASIEAVGSDGNVLSYSIPVIPAWISVVPPLLAIVLAFVLRSVIPSLFIGILMGAWAINGMTFAGAFAGIFDTVTIYIFEAVIDPDHAAIMLFTFLIGGMVGVVSYNGGMVGVVNRVIPLARTSRRGQGVIAGLGLAIFFDDYANTMIVGNATRPISDHLKISREKLAYLVDSTAAPVATIAVITTWIGFQVGLIEEAIVGLEGIGQNAYSLFLNSIPYSFYPMLAIFFVFLVVVTGRDFGPMYRAEVRALATGEVSRKPVSGTKVPGDDEFGHKDGIPCRAINAVLPILVLIGGVIVGMYISGDGDTLQEVVGSADAYLVLIWSSLSSCLVAAALSLSQRILTLNETVDAWMSGARFMLSGLVILVMAWAVADVTSNLQTAPYLISVLGDQLSPYTLPAIVFLLSAAAGFGSGSSWGVMAIMMPLVVPLCWAVLQNYGIADAAHMHILYSCIACVLTGAVWSDHCSPISDTTVLSSLATGCDHMDHVATQIPYALLGGVVALTIGTLPAGYGLPWWVLLLTSAAILFVVHRLLGRSVVAGAAEIIAAKK